MSSQKNQGYYESRRIMPVNSVDPQSYTETPTSVKIIYQKKETKPSQ